MTEHSAVQNPVLKYTQRIGWDYLPPGEAPRQRNGDTGLFLPSVLEEQLLRLNPGVVDMDRAAGTLRRLNDFDDPSRNRYQVTDEWWQRSPFFTFE